MRWIWVRHAETEANLAGRYVGHTDVPLSEKGREQAAHTAKRLALESIGQLYASDLTRAMETARAIGDIHGLVPEPVPSLRELDFGDWDLHTYNEVMQKDPKQLYRWYDDPFTLSPPAGETLRSLGERFDAWLLGQLECQEQKTIVCVTHGGPLRWFLSKWLAGDESSYWTVPGISCSDFVIANWDGREWRRE